MLNNKKQGFTLIELLVVIAIIGMLASTVLVSLGTARAKGRDAKRTADLKNIELAIQLYSDSNSGGVPENLGKLVPKYLAKMPLDPNTGLWYGYAAFKKVGGATPKCIKYHLGAALENKSSVHDGDSDWKIGSADSDTARTYLTLCSASASVVGSGATSDDGAVGTSGSGFDGTQESEASLGKCGQTTGDSGYCFDLTN